MSQHYSTNPKHYLNANTDLMLRAYIVELADKCIAANYQGDECDLATFLAYYIYKSEPVDLRPKTVSKSQKEQP